MIARLLALTTLISAAASTGLAGPSADEGSTSYMIVVTGNELLSGIYGDGHTLFLTRTLRPLGLHCTGSMSVDDRADDIRQALDYASARVPLVIVTGGLGPTQSDLTREVLSRYCGIPLREDPDVLQSMERRFGVDATQLRANLRRQTQVPSRGAYLPNRVGTAVGLVFDTGPRVIVALPGPPGELQPMVLEQLVPWLSHRFGTRPLGCSITVRLVGLGQSQIDQTLQDHLAFPNDVLVTSQFDGGRVDYTFALPQDTPQDRERLESIRADLLQHLGDAVYATDETSLEEHVLQLLARRNQKLTIAEVATGGLLVTRLHSVSAAAECLAGAFLAPTTRQMEVMLPRASQPSHSSHSVDALEEPTRRIANAAAAVTGSDWSLAIGPPGRHRQEQQQVVPVILRHPDGMLESLSAFSGEPLDQSRLATRLLDALRRHWR